MSAEHADGIAPETARIQGVLFDMLIDLAAYFEVCDIDYLLFGGSCLGAVRDGGFITWDDDVDLAQMSLFDTSTDADVLKDLSEIDIQNLTPLDALNTLYRLQSRLKNRWGGPA